LYGCLQVLKGSHRAGRIEHAVAAGQTGADLDRVNDLQQRLELVYCEMKPGTALFFHSNLLHRSAANTSDNSRWCLIACYFSESNIPENPREGILIKDVIKSSPNDRLLEFG
jgi:ectoine hydroxylase-related dioxygenase (phytanoyl-CoA dioxygenase family)